MLQVGEGVPRRGEPGLGRPYRLPQLQVTHDEARATPLGIPRELRRKITNR